MKRKIEVLNNFKARFKRLSKKFKTLNNELGELAETLLKNPNQGIDLGGGLYKIRLASESKGGGKSGGFRVISYYIETINEDEIIYLVTIYDKSEEENIKKDALLKIIKQALA